MLIPSRSQVFATVAAAAASVSFAAPAFAQETDSLPTIRPGACVDRWDDGSLRAHFWYERFGDAPAVLDIPRGVDNDVTPASTVPLKGGRIPERFASVGVWAFDTTLGAEPVTWTLRDPASGEGGAVTVAANYASRCVKGTLATAPDPSVEHPSDSAISVAWTAKVSGVEEFREPGAPDVPWSAWRESCTLDGLAYPCGEKSEVVLEGLAAGRHVFEVFAQAPLPADIGPAAGTKRNQYAFRIQAPFRIARATTPAGEPTPPPVVTPVRPVQPAAPIQPATPAPPVSEPTCDKRKLTIAVPTRGGKRARSASVTVDGKRVRVTKRNGRLVATVPAASITRETVRVKITARYAGGKKKTFTKRMSTCA